MSSKTLPPEKESYLQHRLGRLKDRLENHLRYVQSPISLYYKLKASAATPKLLDNPEILQARRVAGQYAEGHSFGKYSKIDQYIPFNLRRVYALGLHKSPPLRVLDLGAGVGFFLYLSKLHGHTAIGIDSQDDDFYTQMYRAFNVQCSQCTIMPNTLLPDFGQKFDLVTAFAICFHAIDGYNWTADDWRFFVQDIIDHHCVSGGRIHLHFHDDPRGSREDARRKIRQNFPLAVNEFQAIVIPVP